MKLQTLQQRIQSMYPKRSTKSVKKEANRLKNYTNS